MIGAEELEARLAGLDPIGRDGDGWTRLAWTPEDAAAGEWFAEQAARAGLRVERDPAGNRWAVPDAPGPWWATGSHVDTVRRGGRYDGALGVAAGFAVAERLDGRVAVIAFADEEGARFNTPTFGSRALAGRLDPTVLDRCDADGVALRDALGGFDPLAAPAWQARLRGFVELHIDQSRDVARAGAAYGVVSGLAARLRVLVELTGRADHAGTTPLDERADALLAAARVVVRAHDLAAQRPGMRATAGRLLVEPNAPTTVPARARVWLDARAAAPSDLDWWLAALDAPAELQSRSDGVTFDDAVRAALRATGADEVLCFAGHDAGILAEVLPAGMLLVRNPAGVSHAAEEHVSLEDAAVATSALARALERLA